MPGQAAHGLSQRASSCIHQFPDKASPQDGCDFFDGKCHENKGKMTGATGGSPISGNLQMDTRTEVSGCLRGFKKYSLLTSREYVNEFITRLMLSGIFCLSSLAGKHLAYMYIYIYSSNGMSHGWQFTNC